MQDLQRHTFCVAPHPKGPHLSQPQTHGVANSVGEVLRGRQVDLDPRPFRMNSWAYPVAEYLRRQIRDEFGKTWIDRRVLNRVRWQRAPVANEVSEQPEFLTTHGVFLGASQNSW